MKGVYILNLELSKDCEVTIGVLGKKLFKKGIYHYIGSSQNNLDKRIERHKRKEKKLHWHIDYLTTHADFEVISEEKYENFPKSKECELAREYSKKYEPIDNFGCSDCNCLSHLFHNKEF